MQHTIYLIDYHQEFSNLSQQAISELQIIESLALKRASLLVSSSEWAARSAIEHYDVDKQKVHIIPFGANFEYSPAKEQALGKKKIRPMQNAICGKQLGEKRREYCT